MLDRHIVADIAVGLLDQALAADHIDAAGKLADVVSQLSRRLKDRDLIRMANVRSREISQYEKLRQPLQVARQRLANDAEDGEANLLVGRFTCFLADDWPAGLPLLAKGTDRELAELAAQELKQPS